MGRPPRRVPVATSENEALGALSDLRAMVPLLGAADTAHAATWKAKIVLFRFADPDHVPTEPLIEAEYRLIVNLLEDVGHAGFHARRFQRYGGAEMLRQTAQARLLSLERLVAQRWNRSFTNPVSLVGGSAQKFPTPLRWTTDT